MANKAVNKKIAFISDSSILHDVLLSDIVNSPHMLTLTKALPEINDVAKSILFEFKFPAVVLLEAQLGGGKTTLVQKICQLLEVKENVSSPTFNLMNRYQGNYGGAISVIHCDFYRLKQDSILDEIFEVEPPACFLIEWPGNSAINYQNFSLHCGLPLTEISIAMDDLDAENMLFQKRIYTIRQRLL